ncbi:aminodeoxychorismate synthase component I [Streptomyces sp. NPDC006175]|uniref:aminodeoxychorismate synthase component I n=1 Tax=Streptomyces sp. NPDC006175 TaxID=3154471 RepID=UPI0033A7AC02
MKTLLIDNYDSFSHNVAHYLGEINGSEPTVIRNDEPGWRAEHLDGFDNVVISPGPGTPGVPADFGICSDVISAGRIPLLGVCLGHQGIAMLGGGTIALAPEPRHGRKSPVFHDGTGLFAGVPSPQEVVRYHSWAVDRLSDDLEALAWTPDGVLMALRHRERPQWGVQFHPESISTGHGHRLLANFAELSGEWNLRNGRTTRPRLPRPARPGGPDPERRVTYRLLVEEFPTGPDAEQVYEALFLDRPEVFWLDSSRPDPRLGRFSVMGAAEGPLAEVATADVAAGTVTVRSGQRSHSEVRPFLDWLDDRLRTAEVVGGEDLPFDFRGGWVGYLGYELKAQCGAGGPRHRSEHPDACLLFAPRSVVFDHSTATTYLLALYTEDDAPARNWLAATRARIEALPGTPRPPAARPEPAGVPLALRHERGHYLGLIESCQNAIAAGESYEVCLTNMIDVETTLDVWSAYTSLRRDNPAPFAALLRLGDLSVLSTSPERFLRVDGERRVEARPIKGTRPRGRTAEEDRALREDLATCEKDQAENLMIVDLLRNDLAQVAVVGSVAVPELFAVETYATVHQLISTVTARLRHDRSPVDCVRSAFPGGSMTGAPKLRTMEIIDRLEDGPRGIYSGAIGYFSMSGGVDLSIAIRTLVARPGRVSYGVGGAIVSMSDPVAEFDETVVKATPLLTLLGADPPGCDAAGAESSGGPVSSTRLTARYSFSLRETP